MVLTVSTRLLASRRKEIHRGVLFGSAAGRHQTAREFVVRHIGLQSIAKPLAVRALNGAFFFLRGAVLPQPVAPHDFPVVGVAFAVVEQFIDELRAFVGAFIVDKRGDFRAGWNDAHDIDVHAARELIVGADRRRIDVLGAQTRENKTVDLIENFGIPRADHKAAAVRIADVACWNLRRAQHRGTCQKHERQNSTDEYALHDCRLRFVRPVQLFAGRACSDLQVIVENCNLLLQEIRRFCGIIRQAARFDTYDATTMPRSGDLLALCANRGRLFFSPLPV